MIDHISKGDLTSRSSEVVSLWISHDRLVDSSIATQLSVENVFRSSKGLPSRNTRTTQVIEMIHEDVLDHEACRLPSSGRARRGSHPATPRLRGDGAFGALIQPIRTAVARY